MSYGGGDIPPGHGQGLGAFLTPRRWRVAIEHVQHRSIYAPIDLGMEPVQRTECGRRFVPRRRYAYAADAAVHLPVKARCEVCYS